MTPHYLNDFVLNRCRDQARDSDWVVGTNPYEGGSDHVPFLQAGTAGVLFWHFTDQYYHTDGDRMKMVSPVTLWNVGVCAAVSAMVLTSADEEVAAYLVGEVEENAISRLRAEAGLSRAALDAGGEPGEEETILKSWTQWYRSALDAMEDLVAGGASPRLLAEIEDAGLRVTSTGEGLVAELTGDGSTREVPE